MITVVITSCGRLDLLDRTISSFLQFNTYPISGFIIVDDSGDQDIHVQLMGRYPNYELILKEHRGQVECIDDAYSRVTTPYIFHCEDDWEFTKGGFMEPSLTILESNPKVMLVWLLHPNIDIEPEILKADDIEYRLAGNDPTETWHGFTWNPSLRRISEYNLVKPYSQFILNENSAVTECGIGQTLYEKGFKAAILNDEYCHHIGGHNPKRITL